MKKEKKKDGLGGRKRNFLPKRQESRVEGNSTQQRNGPLPAVSASSEGSKNL